MPLSEYAKISNEWLKGKKNLTMNNKLQVDLIRYMIEQRIKHMGSSMKLMPFVFIYKFDREQKDLVKAISANHPLDLINGNWGKIFAGWHRAPTTGNTTVSLTDDAGSAQNCYVYGASPNYNTFFGASGGVESVPYLKCGSGVSAVTEGDYKIETDLLTSPESGYVVMGDASYVPSTNTVKSNTSFNGGASETIKETGSFLEGNNTASARKKIMMTHENISPVFSFDNGDPVVIQYQWLL